MRGMPENRINRGFLENVDKGRKTGKQAEINFLLISG